MKWHCVFVSALYSFHLLVAYKLMSCLWLCAHLLLGFICINQCLYILDASFSENFYGLRRVSCDSRDCVKISQSSATDKSVTAAAQVISDKTRHLTTTERRLSLFFLVSCSIALSSE